MSPLDWVVLVGTLGVIVVYGVWRTRGARDLDGLPPRRHRCAGPRSACRSWPPRRARSRSSRRPGQAYEDGHALRAVLLRAAARDGGAVSAVFVPIYHRLQVFTAYEFLEQRFDVKTRAAGARPVPDPARARRRDHDLRAAIILSAVLGWSLEPDEPRRSAALVIVYTVCGGTQAVSQTQKHQMIVMLGGMVVAFVDRRAPAAGRASRFGDARRASPARSGELNAVDFCFDPSSRYNFWSGLIGGFFLALSYFGTDQSQVRRYLGGPLGRPRAGSGCCSTACSRSRCSSHPVPRRDGVRVLPVRRAAAVLQPGGAGPRGERRRRQPARALEAEHRAAFARKRQRSRRWSPRCVPALPTPRATVAAAARAVPKPRPRSETSAREASALIERAEPRAETKDTRLRLPLVRDR